MWKYYQLTDSKGVIGHYIIKGDQVFSYRPGRQEKTGFRDLMKMTQVGHKVLLILKKQNSPVLFEDMYIKVVMKYVQVSILLEG